MHIGDTNLGMKYLLINSKYSSGADMKLPMYSSTSFRRHLEPYFKEEIIGDVHLSFNFKIGNPQKQALPRNEPPLVSKPIVSKDSPPKITLESKTIQGTYVLTTIFVVMLGFYMSFFQIESAASSKKRHAKTEHKRNVWPFNFVAALIEFV